MVLDNADKNQTDLSSQKEAHAASEKAKDILKKLKARNESLEDQLNFCDESVQWCVSQKRDFLRQRVEVRKAEILSDLRRFREASEVAKRLSAEAKKVDDKLFFVETSLIESDVRTHLGSFPQAKSTLIAARASSAAIYCPPKLQAKMDLQSGGVALNEGDFKSAFSYFYESFEGFNTLVDKENALKSLRYMLLSKMLSDRPKEIKSILSSKSFQSYKREELTAMLELAKAYSRRDLKSFNKAYENNAMALEKDDIVARNLAAVKTNLLERNLQRLVEPYSKIELKRVSEWVDMDIYDTEKSISKMILDKKLEGVIDQSEGVLILKKEEPVNNSLKLSNKIVEELNLISNKLIEKLRGEGGKSAKSTNLKEGEKPEQTIKI